eukprot:GFUD01027972.1.p1 GENE.GFUD01027972.1~~GFUD01027972.1.p1  ORF type:complete len:457 (-),score=93.79 GFUD01027972.1:300-1670(-)
MDSISVQLVTWNVATKFPGSDTNLSSLLNNSKPDIILLGLQEVKAQPQNLLADNLLAGEDPWTASLRHKLAPLGYIKIRSIRLVGIVLSLFTLVKHVPHLRGIETQYTRLGFAGYWGSKGCVSVRFKIYGVSICIVNCHLAAHEQFYQDRVDSYNTVLGSHLYSTEETELILYHDYVFWIGDLNFRLDSESFKFEEVDLMISKNELGKLLAVDQLSKARKSGQAFSELNETLPTFPPSYKYKIGTSVYDGKRFPSWTDRILYKANVANYETYKLSLNQHSYTAHADFLESDHKPVSSNFSLAVFSTKISNDLLLPCFGPIVTFVDTGPCYANEDFQVLYTVKIEDRKYMKTWDWIGVFRDNNTNLEDHLAYTWASTRVARDQVFEVLFDESVFLSPGDFKLVYFSAGARDILGYSKSFRVRFREFSAGPTAARPLEEASEARETEHAREARENLEL